MSNREARNTRCWDGRMEDDPPSSSATRAPLGETLDWEPGVALLDVGDLVPGNAAGSTTGGAAVSVAGGAGCPTISDTVESVAGDGSE